MKKSKLALCAGVLAITTAFGVALTPSEVTEAVAAPAFLDSQQSTVLFTGSSLAAKWDSRQLEEWRGKWRSVKVWPAIEIGSTFKSFMAAEDSFRVKSGGLEYKVEYPGVIESVSVKADWKVKKTIGDSSFIITNTKAFVVRGNEWDSPPTAQIKVEGRFLDASSEIEILKGDPRLQLGDQLDVGRVTMN